VGGIAAQTTNGGENWFKIRKTSTSQFHGVHLFDAMTGWIAGEHGRVLATADGGATWKGSAAWGGTLFAVHFVDAQVGWAVGNNATILKTCDGGG
jgi:photosystem II stability/assembly factor-like uncharacterized protein